MKKILITLLFLVTVAALQAQTSYDFKVSGKDWIVQKGSGALDASTYSYEFTGIPMNTNMKGAVLVYILSDNYWYPVPFTVENTTVVYNFNDRAILRVTVRSKQGPGDLSFRAVIIPVK